MTTESSTISLDTVAERNVAELVFIQSPKIGRKFQSFCGVDVKFKKGDKFITYAATNPAAAKKFQELFAELVERKVKGQFISTDWIAALSSGYDKKNGGVSQKFTEAANQNKPTFVTKFKDKTTEKQKQLGVMIDKNDLTFAIGPAGTGKTHTAVVKAIEGFKNDTYKKILICRPAIATEDLGALPGTEEEKLAPYMRPIYDIMDALLGPGEYQKMLKNKTLEIGAFGTMTGRTFGGEGNEWFVIIDEAQNATVEQLKTAISRLGENSKMVITGDPQQINLPPREQSGLMPCYHLLKGRDDIVDGIEFDTSEVIRSRLVKTLMRALEENPDFKKKSSPPGQNM